MVLPDHGSCGCMGHASLLLIPFHIICLKPGNPDAFKLYWQDLTDPGAINDHASRVAPTVLLPKLW